MALHPVRSLACLLALAGALIGSSVACSSSAGADGGAVGASGGGTTNAAGQTSDETDTGCGGSAAPKCDDGKKCNVGADCADGVCTGGSCAPPSSTDGVKNGDETDVDCGGASAPTCAVDKACSAHADCSSDACNYQKKCVAAKSCTGQAGGDSCGVGETGDASAKHESCCTTVQSQGITVDKYLVTAGRMRAFVERYDGNLQTWAATQPKNWDSSWNDQLPDSMDHALEALGPENKRGCNVVSQGARTYWQDAVDGDPDEKSDFSKDVLDEKALNCVTWYMAQAVCAFDGGRLATTKEISALFTNGGATSYPWGGTGYNAMQQDDHVVHYYSYATPNPPASMRIVGSGSSAYPLDHAFFIAPPGRRPEGANQDGVEDAAGNMLVWVNDGANDFTWTMSWEEHPKKLQTSSWTQEAPDGPDGYYALGVRCVHD